MSSPRLDYSVKARTRNSQEKDKSSDFQVVGGVGTEFDPIDGRQFTADKIRAAVEVAEGYGTYVAAHTYTIDGVRQAIENGVMSIEHANLIDKGIAKMMAKKGYLAQPAGCRFHDLLTGSRPSAPCQGTHGHGWSGPDV